ncbi:MAG: ADP-ribosylglycohydrolase family protein, partial [Blastocatellia bacterium]|nr:ADP-ribosylglycohydrolase family protein [Blastocatellia bacterium]
MLRKFGNRVFYFMLLCSLMAPLGSAAKYQSGKTINNGPRKITRSSLEDKIRGGWAGQMIGVSYGAPTEFRSNGKIIEGNLGGYLDWTAERITNAITQDDLYVEMTFAEVMDRIGLDATTEQYGEAFKNSKYRLWHANASARRWLNQGIKAPWSGHPKYNIHANDIDFQIESDFIGMMTPGLPREANRYAERVGRVMNYGDGLYGGMFVSGMYAAAFFESDPRKVVEAGLASIPAGSGYAKLVRQLLNWSDQHSQEPSSETWKKAWQMLKDEWDKDDPCTDGALSDFNIDARLNGGYIALGLLYGKGDFGKTLEISTRAGQDSDCNPSSAAGVLGVMLGYGAIPDRWKMGLAEIADKKFDYTNYSFNTIAASTLGRALKVIELA